MESKECIHCGKDLHIQASFCPYCMQSQIEKETFPVDNSKHRKRWVIPVCMILLMAIMIFLVLIIISFKPDEPVNENFHETSTSTNTSSTTELTTTIPTTTSFTIEKQPSETETNITTTIQTDTVMTTVTTIPTTTETTVNQTAETKYYLGDYITSGKSYSEVTHSGGIILTFTEQSGNTFTFDIVKYDESGSAADTVTARKIHGEKVDNQILFSFVDDRDNLGTGTLTFQDGKLHLQTGREGTKLVVDTWLEYDSGLFPN